MPNDETNKQHILRALRLQWSTSLIQQHLNVLNPRMQVENRRGFYLCSHVSAFKMKPKLFQEQV